jgi:hypothetical protein
VFTARNGLHIPNIIEANIRIQRADAANCLMFFLLSNELERILKEAVSA